MSARRARKMPASRKKLIPPEGEWRHWDVEYGLPVLRGEITVCQLTMKAVERHYKDLQTAHKRGFVFSPGAAQRPIDYVQKMFQHIKGPKARQPLLLEPFQKFWTAVIFGWLEADTGFRRFRTAFEEMARKNGKSTWWGPLGAYLLTMDGEHGAEVYTIATTRDQAMAVFNPAFSNVKRWIRHSQKMGKVFRVWEGKNQEAMSFLPLEGWYKPLPANAESLDGLNPSAALIDELHAHKTREVWDVMQSAMGARDQPLLNAITTSGFYVEGVYVDVRNYAVGVLNGDVKDDRFFAVIYTLDPDDDPFDERVWIKANPGLGTVKNLAYLRGEAAKAKGMRTALASFKAKEMCILSGDAFTWLDIAVWDAPRNKKKFDRAQLLGRRCFGGLDLASTRDLTAFSLVFPPEEGDESGDWYVLIWAWIPEGKLREASNEAGADYPGWVKSGLLRVVDGEAMEYGPVVEAIKQACAEFDVVEIGFDPYNANSTVNDLLEAGMNMVQFRQGFLSMSAGAKELERLICLRRFRHGGHRLLRWCAGNVAIRMDPAENIKPDKKSSSGRIDPMVATIMAVGRALAHKDDRSVYESRGLR